MRNAQPTNPYQLRLLMVRTRCLFCADKSSVLVMRGWVSMHALAMALLPRCRLRGGLGAACVVCRTAMDRSIKTPILTARPISKLASAILHIFFPTFGFLLTTQIVLWY